MEWLAPSLEFSCSIFSYIIVYNGRLNEYITIYAKYTQTCHNVTCYNICFVILYYNPGKYSAVSEPENPVESSVARMISVLTLKGFDGLNPEPYSSFHFLFHYHGSIESEAVQSR